MRAGTRKSDDARVEILQEALEIIHENFPLDSQFLLIDYISKHEIRKQKWQKAVLNKGIDLDFEPDEYDSYDEDDFEDEDDDEDDEDDEDDDDEDDVDVDEDEESDLDHDQQDE